MTASFPGQPLDPLAILSPPEGFIFAEGDARCGSKHTMTTAVCLLPKGHDGAHRNTQGYWSRSFSSPPTEETT